MKQNNKKKIKKKAEVVQQGLPAPDLDHELSAQTIVNSAALARLWRSGASRSVPEWCLVDKHNGCCEMYTGWRVGKVLGLNAVEGQYGQAAARRRRRGTCRTGSWYMRDCQIQIQASGSHQDRHVALSLGAGHCHQCHDLDPTPLALIMAVV